MNYNTFRIFSVMAGTAAVYLGLLIPQNSVSLVMGLMAILVNFVMAGFFNFKAAIVTGRLIKIFGLGLEANPIARELHSRYPRFGRYALTVSIFVISIFFLQGFARADVLQNVFLSSSFVWPLMMFFDWWHDLNIEQDYRDYRRCAG